MNIPNFGSPVYLIMSMRWNSNIPEEYSLPGSSYVVLFHPEHTNNRNLQMHSSQDKELNPIVTPVLLLIKI